VQKDVKSIMWKYAGMAKTEQSLQEACKKLAELKAVSMKVKPGDAREKCQAVEAHLMAYVGELIAVSSLQRRETRGQFWRLDYPRSDNTNFFFNVVLSRQGDKIEIGRRAVVTTRMRIPPDNPLVGCGCFNYLKPL
jgi:succinate dehydrogenase/fumarate reductase flavoprotein subunit